MPGNLPTLSELRQDLRERLDEITPSFWDDPWLSRVLNEGCRDVARRTECLEQRFVIASVQNQSEYPGVIPVDFIRAHRMEFQVSAADVSVMEYRSPHAMDQFWSGYRNATGRPAAFTIWGPAGSSQTLILYPADNIGPPNQFNLWYYRLPAQMVSDTDTCDLPRGWHELAVFYAEYIGKRKDRDPSWQEAKTLYESAIDQMLELTARHSDQSSDVFGEDATLMGLPQWLTSMDRW